MSFMATTPFNMTKTKSLKRSQDPIMTSSKLLFKKTICLRNLCLSLDLGLKTTGMTQTLREENKKE